MSIVRGKSTVSDLRPEIATDDAGRLVLAQPGASPRPARVARAAHITSATLPAAGAYTSQTVYAVPDGAQFVTFWLAFTKGSATSYPKVKAMLGNGTEEGAAPVVDPTITVASTTNGQQLAYNSELLLAQLTNITGGVVPITIDVRGGATTARLLVAEHGDTANPGTAAVTITAGF